MANILYLAPETGCNERDKAYIKHFESMGHTVSLNDHKKWDCVVVSADRKDKPKHNGIDLPPVVELRSFKENKSNEG